MNIKLYRNNSDNNVLNKDITHIANKQILLKRPTEYVNPVITLEGDIEDEYDYIYIVELDRYYYVVNKVQTANNLVEVHLAIDVLMSYKEKIKQATGIITSNENINNGYIGGPEFVGDVRYTTNIKNFPGGFNDEPQFVLITAGATI